MNITPEALLAIGAVATDDGRYRLGDFVFATSRRTHPPRDQWTVRCAKGGGIPLDCDTVAQAIRSIYWLGCRDGGCEVRAGLKAAFATVAEALGLSLGGDE